MMIDNDKPLKLFAMAVFELRVLLSHKIGELTEPLNESLAANLVYSLHDEALEILEGREIDVERALSKLRKLDERYKDNLQERFIKGMTPDDEMA